MFKFDKEEVNELTHVVWDPDYYFWNRMDSSNANENDRYSETDDMSKIFEIVEKTKLEKLRDYHDWCPCLRIRKFFKWIYLYIHLFCYRIVSS